MTVPVSEQFLLVLAFLLIAYAITAAIGALRPDPDCPDCGGPHGAGSSWCPWEVL